jgi:hypothetical protein
MNIAEAKRTAAKYDLELWWDRSQKLWILSDNQDRVPQSEYFRSSHMHSMEWTYWESCCISMREESNSLDDGPFDPSIYKHSLIIGPKGRDCHERSKV